MLRVGLELLSQLPHVHVNGACVREGTIAPDRSQHLVTEHNASLVADQMAQHLEFPPRHLDCLARSHDASFVEIHTYVSDLNDWLRTGAAVASTPSPQRLDSSQQFGHFERLREVVVGAHP